MATSFCPRFHVQYCIRIGVSESFYFYELYNIQLSNYPWLLTNVKVTISLYQACGTSSLCWKTSLANASSPAQFTIIESSPSAGVWSSVRFENQHYLIKSTLTLEPARISAQPFTTKAQLFHLENRDDNPDIKIYQKYLKGHIQISIQNDMYSVKESCYFFKIIFYCTIEGKCMSWLYLDFCL